MTVVYAGWAKPWFSFRRNDTYFGVKCIMTLGPMIFFIGTMSKDEMLAAIEAEERHPHLANN